MIRVIFTILLTTLAFTANAADEEKPGLTNESALGYVVTGGNSESETTSLKHLTKYNWDNDSLKITGHYIQSSGLVDTPTPANPNAQETRTTAENWSATLRYERVITPKWFNAFLGHGWYGDRFQGVREGQSTDIGAKYFTANSEKVKQFFELGYRYTRELLVAAPPAGEEVGVGRAIMPEYHYARIYAQIDYTYSKTLSLGAWIEYLPSVTDFAEDQRLNYSPYLTSILTDMFSLKVSYEGRYRYKPAVVGNKLTDFTFTTALVASF